MSEERSEEEEARESLENGDGDGDGLKERESGTSSTTGGEVEESLDEDGPGDGRLSMEEESDINGHTQEDTGKEGTRQAEDTSGDGDGFGEMARRLEKDTDTTTESLLADGSGDGDGSGYGEMAKRSEKDNDTSILSKEEEKERAAELKELESQEERPLLKDGDGELREPMILRLGGPIDSE